MTTDNYDLRLGEDDVPGSLAVDPAVAPSAMGEPIETPPPPPRQGDLTSGPILRTLVAFAVPALIGNMLQTINGSINAVWVGQLLGENAVAATANATMIMFLMFGTVFGFGMATTISVGRHFGAGHIDAARRSFGGGIGFCMGLAIVIAVLGWLYADHVLQLMSTPPAIRGEAMSYLRITFASMPFTTVALMVGMGLRGAGDAKTPLYSSILGMIVDVTLNPFLIRGIGPFPQMGIAGSAVSGAIAAVVSMSANVIMLYARNLPLRLRGRELVYLLPGPAVVRYMLTKGLPMGGQMLMTTAAGLMFLGLVNREGVLATAAYGASLQLWNYIQMPAMAVGQAISTMVAQNIGARRHDRVSAITRTGLAVTLLFTSALAVPVLVFDRPVLSLFLGAGSPAVPLARHIQMVCTWSFILSGVMMVLFATMRAYGSVLVPLVVMFVAMYPVRFGFYLVALPWLGADAVWWAYPAGSAASVTLALLAWKHGPWRKARAALMASPAVSPTRP
jgi:putative MATE family efflux protein